MTRNYLTRLALFVALLLLVTLVCSSCSYTPPASMSHRVQILMPDGSVVEGTVDEWTSWLSEGGIRVHMDGVYYRTHISRIVLISEEAEK